MKPTKWCPGCKKDLPLSAFNKNRSKPLGLQSLCRECQRARDRAYYRESSQRRQSTADRNRRNRDRNVRYLWDYLLEHPCVDCGEPDPIVLDFDHQRDKHGNLCEMASHGVSLGALDREIAKCEVRCANCHRRKTAAERGYHKWRRVAQSG